MKMEAQVTQEEVSREIKRATGKSRLKLLPPLKTYPTLIALLLMHQPD